MNKTIFISFDQSQGSLPRILVLVERRGFDVAEMRMEASDESRNLMLMVTPRDSSRCALLLGRQIERLEGVSRVIVHRHSRPHLGAISMNEAMSADTVFQTTMPVSRAS